MTPPLLSPEQAQRLAAHWAQSITWDADVIVNGKYAWTFSQRTAFCEAVEHDLHESLENLRLPEEDGDGR